MPTCPLCRNDTVEGLVFPADVVIASEIRARNPAWSEKDGLCARCLAELEKDLAS